MDIMYSFLVNLIIFGTISLVNGIDSYRLSRLVTPIHYTVQIRPDFDHDIFYGNTLVYVHTKSSVQEIFLHSRNLSISDVSINGMKAVIRYHDYEKISVGYENQTVQPGLHYLFFNYTGIIFEEDGGLVRAPFGYKHENVYVYVTDLEPYYARRVFPCFDEPYFKANFSIRLVAPEGYEAISNMPEISKFSSSKGSIHVFETTVKMSTYLVSFAFTKFPYYEMKYENYEKSWPVKVYSLNAGENNSYVIECAEEALIYYSDYTDIDYPLPKLDMIEYDRNKTTATENWGLITFRKGLLSPDMNMYSRPQIQLVIYHELAHFWFGNLVTNDWWNDLWLQEAFAVYMSYKMISTQKGVTQVSVMLEYQNNDFLMAEYVNETKPVVSHISQPDNIVEKFNDIVYTKGAAILLMLEDIIGEEKFKLSLQTYLKKYAYKTAAVNDFISVVEEIVPQQPIRSFLESYLYQNKFPIITIENINDTFILRQKVCQNSSFGPSRNTWTIPITFITDKNNLTNSKFVWFDKDMDTLEIVESDIKWIVFNPTGIGMYKTELSANMWRNLMINFETMDATVVKSIISNAVSLFEYNLINCDVIINFVKEMENDTNITFFDAFHTYLLPSLACTNKTSYKDAADIYIDFLEKKLDVSLGAYAKDLCDIIDEMETNENLEECTNWILENLDKTTNDVNKRTES